MLHFQQVANFQLLFCEAIYGFIPSFWITIFIVLFEGLMGGAVYANAFYYITKQVCCIMSIYASLVPPLTNDSKLECYIIWNQGIYVI